MNPERRQAMPLQPLADDPAQTLVVFRNNYEPV
jgi:hypothetical protein